MPFIGIDLGTTYSCVAADQNGKVEIFTSEHGKRTTPSCVSFTDERRLVGVEAQRQMVKNSQNTIYDAKRLIGRLYNDPAVQSDKTRWPFKIIDEDGKPKIAVNYKKNQTLVAPEQVASMVLHCMKKRAEEAMGEGVLGAVITVPAYFNGAQREATMDAARIADLHVLSLLNEPTAAAIAYGLNKNSESKRNVLIYDLGGGTFDVTVLTIHRGDFEVKATNGDTHLGGQDFSDRLFKHFSSAFAARSGVDIRTKPKAESKLRDACENAKLSLSTAMRASIDLDGEDFDTFITRERFEKLNEDLFKGTMGTVEKALAEAEMEKGEIADVVLVGGSTRIPKIQQLLVDYFGSDKICKTINPDEAVAMGAAAYAASLSGKPTPAKRKFNLKDVTPLSIGIKTKGGVMTTIIKKNTTIPVTKSHNFSTSVDNQVNVNFSVFEGERIQALMNRPIGKFVLKGIPPAPARTPNLKTCFDIDGDGVLKITAVEKSGGKECGITIYKEGRERDEKEIKRMIEEAIKFRNEDEQWIKRAHIINEIETLAHKAKKSIEEKEPSEKKEMKQRKRALEKCKDVLASAAKNPDLRVEKLEAKMRELKAMLD